MSAVLHFLTKLVQKPRFGKWFNQTLTATEGAIRAPLLDSAAIQDLYLRAQHYLQQFSAQIQQRKPAKEIAQRFLGDVRSVYKGAGFDYEESRAYQSGDELRMMDWRLTARSGVQFIKVYREDRRPGSFILVDRRSSMRFGTRVRLKATQGARVATLLAFAHRQLNSPLAGMTLQSTPLWMPQSNDEQGVFHFVHNIIAPCPPLVIANSEPDLMSMLKSLLVILERGSNIYLVSDFKDLEEQSRSVLLHLAAEHEVNAVHIVDPAETQLPNAGQLSFADTIAAQPVSIDTADPVIRKQFQQAAEQYLASREQLFNSLKIPYMRVMSDNDDIDDVLRLIA